MGRRGEQRTSKHLSQWRVSRFNESGKFKWFDCVYLLHVVTVTVRHYHDSVSPVILSCYDSELLSARWGNQVYRGASENVVLALCFGALIQHGAFCARLYTKENVLFRIPTAIAIYFRAVHIHGRGRGSYFCPLFPHLILSWLRDFLPASSSSSHRITSWAKESVQSIRGYYSGWGGYGI